LFCGIGIFAKKNICDAAMILSSGLPRRPPRRMRLRAVRSPSVVGFHHVGRPAPVRGLSPPVWIFGNFYSFVPAAFRIRTKSNWQDSRWLPSGSHAQIFLHWLFVQLLKIHPDE
jgi:hypothetical protein